MFFRETNPGFESHTSSSPRETPFGGDPGYRLPNNHSRPKETDPEFEFPAANYLWHHRNLSQLVSFPAMFFRPGYRQTNRQTNFYFVRPSFQSRGKWHFVWWNGQKHWWILISSMKREYLIKIIHDFSKNQNHGMILMQYSLFIDEIKIHQCFCPFQHLNDIFLMF